MIHDTSIKMTIDGSDTIFYADEVRQVTEMPEQNIIVHQSQQKAATVKVYDTQYKAWNISISVVRGDTWTRLLTIINSEDIITFYPYYTYDASSSFNAILVPDNVEKRYTFGELEARVLVTFNLLECSK